MSTRSLVVKAIFAAIALFAMGTGTPIVAYAIPPAPAPTIIPGCNPPTAANSEGCGIAEDLLNVYNGKVSMDTSLSISHITNAKCTAIFYSQLQGLANQWKGKETALAAQGDKYAMLDAGKEMEGQIKAANNKFVACYSAPKPLRPTPGFH